MRPARPLASAFVLLAACGAPSTAPTSGARRAPEMPRSAAAPPARAAAPRFEGVVRGPDGKSSPARWSRSPGPEEKAKGEGHGRLRFDELDRHLVRPVSTKLDVHVVNRRSNR